MPLGGPDDRMGFKGTVVAALVVVIILGMLGWFGHHARTGSWGMVETTSTSSENSGAARISAANSNKDAANDVTAGNGVIPGSERGARIRKNNAAVQALLDKKIAAARAAAENADSAAGPASSAHSSGAARTLTLHGRALDKITGQPIEGVLVELGDSSATVPSKPSPAPSVNTTASGADGAYTVSIVGVAGASYRASVLAPLPYVLSEPAEKKVQLGFLTEENLKEAIDLHFEKGVTVNGLVVWDTGDAIPGAKVEIVAVEQGIADPAQSFETDKAGKFKLAATARTPLSVACTFKKQAWTGSFIVPVAEPMEEMKITLPKKATISGTIYLPGGGPASQVMVSAQGSVGGGALSDESGSYEIEGLEPGRYTVSVVAPAEGNLFPPKQQVIEIAGKEDKTGVDFTLLEGETINVLVVDKDGAPIENAIAQWEAQVRGKPGAGKTGSDGRLVVTGIPPNGTVANLVISHDEYQPETRRDIHPLDGEQRIVLQKSNNITLVVKWQSDESPVTAYAYRLLKSGWNDFEIDAGLQQNRVNDPEGRTTLKEIASGKWRIEVTVLDEVGVATTLREASEFDLDAGEANREVVVKLAGGRTVDGYVTLHSDGPPVAGATVRFEIPLGTPGGALVPINIGEQVTDASGRFHFEGVPIGRHVITADKNELRLAQPYDLTLKGDTKLEPIHLVLEVGGVVYGTIRNKDGELIPGARIHDYVVAPNSNAFQGKTYEVKPDGSYYIDGLTPGVHFILAMGDSMREQKDIDIVSGEKKELNFGPTPGVTIHGVIYKDGRPAQMDASLVGTDRTFVTCHGDADGSYTANAPPGVYYTTGGGLQGLGPKVTVAPSPQDQTLNLHIDAAEVDIVLVFPEDASFAPGMLILNPRERFGRWQFTRVEMAQTSHHMANLAAGEYQATFSSKDGQWQGDSGWLSVDGAENTFTIEVKKTAAGVRVGGWVPGQLDMNLQTVSYDATEVIKSKGSARALVHYEKGRHAVFVAWAALLMDGHEISRDAHDGWSGFDHSNDSYRLQIPIYEAGHSYQLQINIRGDGGGDTQGSVYLSLN
ncbi:hypothetical protein BH09SUM1_BH09SUM1_19790 [soil metagenome]